MAKVKFLKEDVEIEVPKNANLKEFCIQNKLKLYIFPENVLNCHGKGFCQLCRIKVDHPEKLSAPTERELATVAFEGENYRLACQCHIVKDGDLQIITRPRKAWGWRDHPVYHKIIAEEVKVYGF